MTIKRRYATIKRNKRFQKEVYQWIQQWKPPKSNRNQDHWLRWIEILIKRYIQERTLYDIGKEYGMSKQRVSIILNKIKKGIIEQEANAPIPQHLSFLKRKKQKSKLDFPKDKRDKNKKLDF